MQANAKVNCVMFYLSAGPILACSSSLHANLQMKTRSHPRYFFGVTPTLIRLADLALVKKITRLIL